MSNRRFHAKTDIGLPENLSASELIHKDLQRLKSSHAKGPLRKIALYLGYVLTRFALVLIEKIEHRNPSAMNSIPAMVSLPKQDTVKTRLHKNRIHRHYGL